VCFDKGETFLPKIDNKYQNLCYIVDENVWRLYKDGCLKHLQARDVFVLPISEEKKCLKTVFELYDHMMKMSAKRNMVMVSVGGGIVQDITGFAASTLYRGIKWVFIPTTYLAQADSCIGSKTSLNYDGFKNIIGSFYPPDEIFVDPGFLKTQKDIDFYSGLGEVVKLHMIGGEGRVSEFKGLLQGILAKNDESLLTSIKNSLYIKKSYIEADEFDVGLRNMLNFGHCFGHALETTSNFELPHGQAVILGMILANIVSRQRGMLSREVESHFFTNLLQPSIAVDLKGKFIDADQIIPAMKNDKKRTGKGLALILMGDDYKMKKVDDLEFAEAILALKRSTEILNIKG